VDSEINFRLFPRVLSLVVEHQEYNSFTSISESRCPWQQVGDLHAETAVDQFVFLRPIRLRREDWSLSDQLHEGLIVRAFA
jgi:hypothetical protein